MAEGYATREEGGSVGQGWRGIVLSTAGQGSAGWVANGMSEQQQIANIQ
jgi:hypothetical protein